MLVSGQWQSILAALLWPSNPEHQLLHFHIPNYQHHSPKHLSLSHTHTEARFSSLPHISALPYLFHPFFVLPPLPRGHEHLCSFLTPDRFSLWLWIVKHKTGTRAWNWASYPRLNWNFKQETHPHQQTSSFLTGSDAWEGKSWMLPVDRQGNLHVVGCVKKRWCHRHRGITYLLHQQTYPEKQAPNSTVCLLIQAILTERLGKRKRGHFLGERARKVWTFSHKSPLDSMYP